MNELEKFIEQNKADMLEYLTDLVSEVKKDIKASPEDYLDPMDPCSDTPSIDVRLCIDIAERYGMRTPSWIFRTGDSSYDPVHSEFCSASCITEDTNPAELLDELIDQLFY